MKRLMINGAGKLTLHLERYKQSLMKCCTKTTDSKKVFCIFFFFRLVQIYHIASQMVFFDVKNNLNYLNKISHHEAFAVQTPELTERTRLRLTVSRSSLFLLNCGGLNGEQQALWWCSACR